METKRNKTVICNYVCGVIMVLLIVLQFIPYWNFGGQSAVINHKTYQSKKEQSISINSYVWSNPENTDLVLYFSENVDEDIVTEKEATGFKIPLKTLATVKEISGETSVEKSGVYVKSENGYKFKEVEVISKSTFPKDNQYAIVKPVGTGADELLLDDQVVIPYNEDLLKEEYNRFLDTVGGIPCWQLTFAIVGIGFCLAKKKTGVYALFPLANGIYGTYFYLNNPILRLSSLWMAPFVVNILMILVSLVTLCVWAAESARK